MSGVKANFERFINEGKCSVIEQIEIPPRQEQRKKIPSQYTAGFLGQWLERKFGQSETLWNHQSLALEKIAAGENIVVATGTASGKSLIFQLAIMRELLEHEGRAVVVYPLKALLSDQVARWRSLVAEFGYSEDVVAEVHGNIMSDDRLEAIRNARIIAVTPDILQAWFMRQVSSPAFRELLCRLRFLVLDEAHVYESVFGSNVAYLMRRFLVARRRACRERKITLPLGLIAATATIADPIRHMHSLTGWNFAAIEQVDDGSPTYGRRLLHIEGPDHGSDAEGMLADIIADISNGPLDGSFIAFHNSRQGVERVTKTIDRDDVLPYRSGYGNHDRTKIESLMRKGKLQGVVATSALELGIDVSGFTTGINLGVPESKKSFRQRLGRVGRAAPGIFAVIASRHAFTQFGSSFLEYYEGSVEPSHLYVENRFIQFAHARCLMDESDQMGFEREEVPPSISWPDTFPDVYEKAKPAARRPKEFDFIAQLGANSPHVNYPLRQVGEPSYTLKEGRGGAAEYVGDIAINQAIREAYPGALYLHFKRPMKVREWRLNSFDRTIRLEEAKSQGLTRPILRKSVNVGASSEDIIGGRVMASKSGVLAEVNLQVNEAVLGFNIGSKQFLYRDLRSKDPNMTTKQRDFITTGVILRIDEPWFAGGAGEQAQTRRAMANALKELLLREKSIAQTDVDEAHTHIAFYENGVPKRATDTVVIYDSIYGGLRLTEPLFSEFGYFIGRLEKAAGIAGSDAMVDPVSVDNLSRWFSELSEGVPTGRPSLTAPTGEFIIYAPGSLVSVKHNGSLIERELIEPQLFAIGSTQMLMYKYSAPGGGEGWVPHDQIEATGQDWKYVFWNPETGETTDPESLSEGIF